MAKMTTFFLVVWAAGCILSATMQGSGGVLATDVAVAVGEADVVITVDSTSGYPPSAIVEPSISDDQRVIWIEGERIEYTAITTGPDTFTGCTRGTENGEDAGDHPIDAKVYSNVAWLVNAIGDYEIVQLSDTAGAWTAPTTPWEFVKSAGTFIILPLTFAGEDLAIITYIYSLLGAGYLLALGMSLAGSRRV